MFHVDMATTHRRPEPKDASLEQQPELQQRSATTYTLQVVLQPATEISTKESPALTQPVQFLDNGVSLGSVALTGDGTYAFMVIASPPSGTHVYTALIHRGM
jgi:hypothetical protein